MDGIRVREIRKRFHSVQALDGVSLDVEPGDVVALLGPNGAGKSTLIRTLGTTVLPDAGTATVAGCDVVRDAVGARRSTGLVIGDERSHYWRLSGRRNLGFFAALAGMSRREAAARTARLMNEVGLADAADRPVLGYSSGMRARLSLARALLADPPVLLLDEPTKSLDPLAASRFREIAARLADKRRAAVLFATHDLHEAAAVAARVLVLSAGRIVLHADTEGMDAITLGTAFFDAVQSSGEDQPSPEQVVAKA